MSKIINGLKWHNGREICRIVCNLLGDYGMAVVNWVDMSDHGIDRREDRAYNIQLVFTMFRAQRDGKFVTVVQMAAIPMDGRANHHVADFSCANPGEQVTDEHIAELLHNVVDDDSEPQYTVIDGDESGWYVSDGSYDMNIARYDETEWPFDGDDPVKDDVEAEEWDRANAELNSLVKGMPLGMFKGVVNMVKGFVEATNG